MKWILPEYVEDILPPEATLRGESQRTTDTPRSTTRPDSVASLREGRE